MTKFEEYKEVLTKSNELIENHGAEIIKDMFAEVIKQHKGLSTLVVSGYVPSFNDGDACEFTVNTMYGYDAWDMIRETDDYELLKEIVKFEGAEDEFDPENFEDFELDPKANLDWSDCYHLLDEYHHLLEQVYGTGFLVVAQLNDDGTVTVTKKSYDCGY